MNSPPPCSASRLTVATGEALTADEVENALDEQLDAVLSTRRTATRIAAALAPLPRHEQDFALHWVAVIARTNPEMAFQFAAAVTFEDVVHVLQLFVCSLSGRRMKLDAAAQPHTDTDTLFLPPRIAFSLDKNTNFLICNIIYALLWAQSRFGTFNADLQTACDAYADPQRAGTAELPGNTAAGGVSGTRAARPGTRNGTAARR